MRRVNCSIWTLEPFKEIGANFSLQLSSRTRFDKINKKKFIAENQCEKHKQSSLIYWIKILQEGSKDKCPAEHLGQPTDRCI